jgi:ribosomal protein L31
MKKQIHPQLAQSIIQLKDGSIFTKKWLFFRQQLFLEIDYGSHRF